MFRLGLMLNSQILLGPWLAFGFPCSLQLEEDSRRLCAAVTVNFVVEGSKKEQLPAVIGVSLGRKPSYLVFLSGFPFGLPIKTSRKRSDRLSAADWSLPAESGVRGKP